MSVYRRRYAPADGHEQIIRFQQLATSYAELLAVLDVMIVRIRASRTVPAWGEVLESVRGPGKAGRPVALHPSVPSSGRARA